ncbi:hypothetical protein PR202_ga13686 [Eleusine coracana subsp. coracana]|uniref:Ubiquitin carboxyl-terminal hydrolase n=1 Tax=Eleusine coracana subsp. coracana TaxID=191504 RepID=A0AAV5CEQ7_ELECO|nr:hypothetical protein PR202_ga13686 [Eleusine coracana subsp. coracana]
MSGGGDKIQFGSLDPSVLSLTKTSEPITKSVVPPAKSTDEPTIAVTKDTFPSNKQETIRSILTNGAPLLANGCLHANVSPNNGGVCEYVKKTEAVVPSGVPVKSISNSAPHTAPEVHKDGIDSTYSSNSVNKITENGNSVTYKPSVAAPVIEAVTGLNKASPNMPLLPHGLKNTGNICFLNATLQALLSCSPFVQLLQELRNRRIPKVGYPMLSVFVEFISQFDMLDDSIMKKNEKAPMVATKPFSPAMFDSVLRNFTPDVAAGISARPRQEDAQEFLSFAIDRMHDELLKLNGSGSNSKEGMVVSSVDDDAWETVGRKNKSAIVRTQSFVPSELSAIFGGQLQSVVKAQGNKASATVQPFLLHLDIFPDGIQTLEHAFHIFSAPESLEGYRTAAGKNQRRYELISTITHHGKDLHRGHYTAHAKHASGQWLRFDDDHIMPVSMHTVLNDEAYVLFYKQV